MTGDARTEILALGARWAEAERSADTTALGEITADGFRLVGPFGFVREAYLEPDGSDEDRAPAVSAG
jgi:hypothetical protein